MKKTLVAIVVIAVLLVAGVPYLSGFIMEKTVRASLVDINQMYADQGSNFTVSIVDYQRGYSSSQIEYKLDLGIFKSMYGIKDIIFVDSAEHGFTKVVSQTSLEKNPWFIKFLDTCTDGKNPLKITTEYHLTGKIDSRINLEAFSFKDKNGTINVLPANITIQSQNGFESFTTAGQWQGIKGVSEAQEEIKFGPLSFDSAMTRVTSRIWKGTAAFKLDELNTDEGVEPFALSNLSVKYNIGHNEESDTLNLGMICALDRLQGDGADIKNATARFALNNMDAAGYEEFMAEYTKIMNQVLENMGDPSRSPAENAKAIENQMAMLGLRMMGLYEKLLTKDLELNISECKAELPQGHVTGTAGIRLKKDMTFAQFAPVMANPDAILDIIDFKSDVTIPAVFVLNNPMLTAPAYPGMQTGLFMVSGDTATHQSETRDGKFYLNGKEVVLTPQ